MTDRIELPQIVRLPDGRLMFRAILHGKEIAAEISPSNVRFLLASIGRIVAANHPAIPDG